MAIKLKLWLLKGMIYHMEVALSTRLPYLAVFIDSNNTNLYLSHDKAFLP